MKATTLICLALMAIPSMAQKKQFTLDDLIPGGSTYYAHSVPQNKYLTWWGDNCIELGLDECKTAFGNTNGAGSGKENNKHDSSEKLASASNLISADGVNGILTAAGFSKVQHLYYASFPYADSPLVLLPHGKERTLVNWAEKKAVWHVSLPSEAEDEDWNKVSRNTAYTVGNNLHVLTADGQDMKVSQDGSIDIVYGKAVHRNEFGIEKGTFWSPDGQMLAFYRMDQSMVSKYPQVNMTPVEDVIGSTADGKLHSAEAEKDSRCATIAPDPYPMAGETSHKVTVGIYDVKSKEVVYLNTGDPTDRYFTNISWSPDGSKLYLIELNRDQNHGSLDEYDVATGNKVRSLFSEDNEKYFEPSHPIQFLPWDNNKFIYQTRRDGYNHIYLYDVNGKQIKQLTKGTFEVSEVLGFNVKQRSVIYTSNAINPLQQNVYSVDMKGKMKQIGDGTGWHQAELSPDGGYVIDRYSSPEIARRIDIVNTSNGKMTNVHNADDPWDEYELPTISVGTIKAADGVTDLYYRLILPPHFDETKKYPAVVYLYGGPHAHVVDASRNWGARGWDIWMAQKGYVMFSIDNRGSENRGLDFEQATFRHLGTEEMKDQICGVNFLKSLPYVDADRLGVHGWSFGGFMTTSLMTTYPDVFKVAVAGGPVIDWRFYEVMYGERYMDTPQTNPEGYDNASLLNKAKNLKGRLMIIYGGNDPVCVPQHTISFIRACIDAGTYPDLFTYPGDGHNMMGTDRVHLHNVITRYFEDHLK